MTKRLPVGSAATTFPPSSQLHSQIETLARELHDARARLVALDSATGQAEPPLRAPSIPLVRPIRAVQPGDAACDPILPPVEAPWWPRVYDRSPTMTPSPGTRCAGLAQPGVPVLAISCCGLSEDLTAETIERVVAEQMQARNFVALYLTDDSRCLHLFRYQGLDVELVPGEAELAACSWALAPETVLSRRMAGIKRTWGIAEYRDLGTRALPWPETDELAPQEVPVVVFDRDYRRHNPYQHLLHVAMPGLTFRPGAIDRAIETVASGRRTVFHLNWEEALYRPAADEVEAGAMIADFLSKVDGFASRGGRLVWTLHNEAPHEDCFPDAYQSLAQGVAERSDLVIVHSQRAADLATELYGVVGDRLCVVPHGSYHDLYPAGMSAVAAREALGLPTDGILFGFVGAVRPYKNIPLLVEALRRLPESAGNPPVRLLIAGQQMTALAIDPDDTLQDRLVMRDGKIPENLLAAHVRACDAMVLPFERILTSGSMVLALSLGVPVIVPDLPSLSEVVQDGVNGLVFRPGDADALAARMSDFIALGADEWAALARNATITARLHDWSWIGRHIARRIHALFRPETNPLAGDLRAAPGEPALPDQADLRVFARA